MEGMMLLREINLFSMNRKTESPTTPIGISILKTTHPFFSNKVK
jgi:hypothetical protein